MRGKGKAGKLLHGHHWITPAYAGKSSLFGQPRHKQKDHPRLCGEKLHCCNAARWGGGSPPPMRGKVQPATVLLVRKGITPAYAGKRGDMLGCWSAGGDHPRLCGEKPRVTLHRYAMSGSPPPMRGKVIYSIYSIPVIRITPAYAGKSTKFRTLVICH